MVFIGVDLDQIDKMAPRRVKSAPGPIELNQHFGAKTDLLDLESVVEQRSIFLYLFFTEVSKRNVPSSKSATLVIRYLTLR